MKNRQILETRPIISWLKLADIKAILLYMMKPNTLVKSKRARAYVSIEENSYSLQYFSNPQIASNSCVHMKFITITCPCSL